VIQKARQKCNDSCELDCMGSLQEIIKYLIKHNATCDCMCVRAHAESTKIVTNSDKFFTKVKQSYMICCTKNQHNRRVNFIMSSACSCCFQVF
jgi:hypothetical protein